MESSAGNITLDALLVDDEAVVLKINSALLERLGVNVSTAKDGIEGLERYKESAFDLVLTDINMPRMSGTDIIKEILKAYPRAKDSIYALSGYCTDQHKAEIDSCLGKGRLLMKPIENGDIHRIVQEVFQKKYGFPENIKYIANQNVLQGLGGSKTILQLPNPGPVSAIELSYGGNIFTYQQVGRSEIYFLKRIQQMNPNP